MGQHLVDAHVHAENIFNVVWHVPAPVIIFTWFLPCEPAIVSTRRMMGGLYSSGAVSSPHRRATGRRPVRMPPTLSLDEVPSPQILVLVLRHSVPASPLDSLIHQQPAVSPPQPRRMHRRLSPQRWLAAIELEDKL